MHIFSHFIIFEVEDGKQNIGKQSVPNFFWSFGLARTSVNYTINFNIFEDFGGNLTNFEFI